VVEETRFLEANKSLGEKEQELQKLIHSRKSEEDSKKRARLLDNSQTESAPPSSYAEIS